jgi:ABC-type antimicrobial peptide transport system permease subunit
LYVRTAGDPAAVAPALARTIAAIDPRVLVMGARTIAEQIDDQLAVECLLARLAVGFAVIAIFVAAVGLYAVTAYEVSTRTQEFGVRAALGATAGTLLRMVLQQTVAIIAVGTAAGVLLSLATANAARALLFGLQPSDPAVLALAAILVTAVTLVAAAVPAHRASRVSPAIALRA